MTFRPLPGLTLLALLTLALLVWLGAWQWARYETKTRAASAPPVALQDWGAVQHIGPPRAYLYAVLNGQAGWRVLVPVRTDKGADLIVDSAFAPGLDPPTSPPAYAYEIGEQLRAAPLPRRAGNAFLPKSTPTARRLFTLDAEFAPAAILLAAPYAGGANPFTALRDPLPPSRHLGYALTWWGLALGLIGVYAVYHHKCARLIFAA